VKILAGKQSDYQKISYQDNDLINDIFGI